MTKQDMGYINGSKEIKEMSDEFFYGMVGPGWEPFVKEFIELVEENKGVVHQIKEKFGHLRLYSSLDHDEELYEKIDKIAHKAAGICEECGNIGRTISIRGWYKTICLLCEDERKNAFNR